jgi:hypothetical protein
MLYAWAWHKSDWASMLKSVPGPVSYLARSGILSNIGPACLARL